MKRRRGFKNIVFISFALIFGGAALEGQAAEVPVDKPVFKIIGGGRSLDAARPIEFNRDYKLEHHLKKGEFNYFFVYLKPDSIVTLEVETFEKGIAWNNKRRVITTEPFAGLQLRDRDGTILGAVRIDGSPNEIRKASFRNRSPSGGTYYISVGSPNGSLHKDHVAFKVTVSPFIHGDLGSHQDAGSTPERAFGIMPARYYPVNSIGGGDSKDLFAFSADKKEWYSLAIRGDDPIPVPFRVTVWSNEKQKRKKLVSYISGATEQVVTRSFKIPKEGQYFVEISLMGPASEKSLYSLELLKVAGQ